MTQTLTDEQQLILSTVRQFVEKEVIPVASAMEHSDEYPHALVSQMKEMGLFGLNIPEAYGGAEVDTTTFAMIFEEISRGWLGLAGILGSNSVMCDVIVRFGTDEQKCRYLPSLATGERRGGICLTESNAGTDLQSITTTATRHGDIYRINGSKMWITNARQGNTFLLLAKTDPGAPFSITKALMPRCAGCAPGSVLAKSKNVLPWRAFVIHIFEPLMR